MRGHLEACNSRGNAIATDERGSSNASPGLLGENIEKNGCQPRVTEVGLHFYLGSILCPFWERRKFTIPARLQVENSSLQGDRHRVSTITCIELRQDTLHMRLDSSIADIELRRDQLVRLSRRDAFQDLGLALGQRVVGDMLSDFRRNLWRHPPLARMDGSNGSQKLGPHQVLEQITRC